MMFKHLGTFAILAVCFFAMLISGCPGRVQDIVPPLVADPGTEPTETAEPVTEEPVTEPSMGVPDGMVLIPAGSFEMGSADADADADERPVHTVHLDAFYMDVYEVTNAEFKEFVDANPGVLEALEDKLGDTGNLSHWNGTDYPAGRADHPVRDVSWTAAAAYAGWAGKRLPTEAEWEYAARGGLAGQKYPWGDTITPNDANYANNVGNTTPVGQYPANRYGLYDMAGNVWEWCLDVYDADFYAASDNSRNPIAGGESSLEFTDDNRRVRSERVTRGGSWLSVGKDLRVTQRSSGGSWIGNRDTGFRCVRPVTSSPGTEPPDELPEDDRLEEED